MKKVIQPTYEDIDWNLLRENALIRQGWKRRPSENWDRKAESFARRGSKDPYASLLLQHLPLQRDMSVLDIGCGPGTLALPISRKVSTVTAMDYSQGMLEVVNRRREDEQRTNITTVCCSWEDDWQAKGIIPHDLAIASRALAVENLSECLQKLDRYGKQFVFVTEPIGSTPFEPDAFTAIGREFIPGPDYIYTLNTLYCLGIHANVTVLKLAGSNCYPNTQAAFEAYAWMFGEMTAIEQNLLRDYISQQTIYSRGEQVAVRRRCVPRWALLWWHKTE